MLGLKIDAITLAMHELSWKKRPVPYSCICMCTSRAALIPTCDSNVEFWTLSSAVGVAAHAFSSVRCYNLRTVSIENSRIIVDFLCG